MSNVVINSTGQTADDLANLIRLGQLSATTQGKPFVPPALLNPNYVPPNRGHTLFAVAVALFVVSFVCVALRIAARFVVKVKKVMLEDYMIIIALLLDLGVTIIICITTRDHQLGMHVYDIHFHNLETDYRTAYPYQILNIWCNIFIRLSIIILVRRLYYGTGSKWIHFCTAFGVINILFGIAVTLALTFNCHREAIASSIFYAYHKDCSNLGIYYALTAISFSFDLITVALPVKLVLGLTLPPFKKAGVAIMFGLGAAATGASVARFAFLATATNNVDFTWAIFATTICTQIESNIGIVTACFPALKVLFTEAKNTEVISKVTRTLTSNLGSKQGSKNGTNMSSTDQRQPLKKDRSVGDLDRVSVEDVEKGIHLENY